MTERPIIFTAFRYILSLGAGVQSTTLYLLCLLGMQQRGEIDCAWAASMLLKLDADQRRFVASFPPIECAIFADTGDEPGAMARRMGVPDTEGSVYAHLDWLMSLDGPPINVRMRGCLGDDIVFGVNAAQKSTLTRNNKRFASIPTYTMATDDETSGRTRRQCTSDYKIFQIEKFIRYEVLQMQPRQRLKRPNEIVQLIGISLDEKSRATSMWEAYHLGRRNEAGKIRYAPFKPEFPLIESGMTRANCLEWLDMLVPHKTPRSACVFCPFHDDREWAQLRDRGGLDWERAVYLDTKMREPGVIMNRGMDKQMYLHRSCKPLTEIDFRPRENRKEMQLGFQFDCLGVCGV